MKTIEYIAKYTLREEPVFISVCEEDIPCGIKALSFGERVFPASRVESGIIAVLTAEKGERLELVPSEVSCGSCEILTEDTSLRLTVNGHSFAEYCFDTAFPKPHMGPVTDDNGNNFTRCELMHPEHPHQRSIIVAIGDVNGVDCWNEPADSCGYVRNEEIYDVFSSSAFASFKVRNLWTDHNGDPLMTESTAFTVYNQSEACRMLDIEITFTADHGDVVFGPTKEAGPLGIRLRDELRADKGKGMLYNSNGQHDESECWGKDAEWCDYHGNIDGVGEMGITVFDSPDNERHPTAWHIRAYGLFAANNLFFKGGFTLPLGESITYKYRILFRRSDMTPDEISEKYSLYSTSD